MAYLRLAANFRDALALERIINVPSRKIGQGSVDKMKAEAARQDCSIAELVFRGCEEALDQWPPEHWAAICQGRGGEASSCFSQVLEAMSGALPSLKAAELGKISSAAASSVLLLRNIVCALRVTALCDPLLTRGRRGPFKLGGLVSALLDAIGYEEYIRSQFKIDKIDNPEERRKERRKMEERLEICRQFQAETDRYFVEEDSRL